MDKNLTKQLLLSSSYWVLNKEVVMLLGIETAFLLSNFAEAEQMMADDDGWFYQTIEIVEEMTTLSRYKQDQSIKELEEMGILEKETRGMPAKRYFKINYECLTNLLVKKQQTSVRKIDRLDCKKSTTNKERIYKKRMYKENTKDIVHTPDEKQSEPDVIDKRLSHLPKEKIEDVKTNLVEERFDTFWKVYPRKIGKGASRKVWMKLKPSQKLLEQMLETVEAFKDTDQWKRENGQYIPHPSTWLNQGRWEDEVPADKGKNPNKWYDPKKGTPDHLKHLLLYND